jgi:hypothetical protein
MDTAVKFIFDGLTFIVINIQYNGLAELPWVSSVLAPYPDAHVIVATHAFIDECGETDGTLCGSATFGPILHTFISSLEDMMNADGDVFLTLNGHYTNGTSGAYFHELNLTGSTGRWELMFNRQGVTNSRGCRSGGKVYSCSGQETGAASVTTLTFDLASGTVYANTFSIPGAPTVVQSYRISLFIPITTAFSTSIRIIGPDAIPVTTYVETLKNLVTGAIRRSAVFIPSSLIDRVARSD